MCTVAVAKRRFASGDASTDSKGPDMEWLDVLRRIDAGEDWRTEFKRGLGDLSEIGKAICAFGNGEGGLIILGIDKAGMVVSVEEYPEKYRSSALRSWPATVDMKTRTGVSTGWKYLVNRAASSRSIVTDSSGSAAGTLACQRLLPSGRNSSTTSVSC